MKEEIKLTKDEAESLLDYLEINLIQNIKDNPDVDSMVWLDNIMSIWRKCGGRNNYTNEKEE